ncbi:MAG TPA: DUF2064 domain-containing protein [Gemmatimonadaceae bacterium]|jgi:glycosyltransferase A (GT-A) superfamily protein (DUF2064 family)
MQVIENEDTNKRTHLRERAQRRAIESISLSDDGAGERMTEIVRNRLEDGSQRVIITHAERELPIDIVEHAFEALRYSALVCAPDGDGDISLIGMTEPHDALLASIPWGAENALDELLSAARASNVPVTLLPPAGSGRNGSS